MTLPGSLSRASDGSLLLVGGAHVVLDLCQGRKRAAPDSVETFWHNQGRRRAFCDARGIRYQMVVFQDKLVAFAGQVPGQDGIVSPYLRDYAPSGEGVLYPLLTSADFLRTDTHLSARGMARVTRLIVEGVGISDHAAFDTACAERTVVNPALIGDLGVKCDPPESEEAVQFRGLAAGRYGSNRMMVGNDGIIDLALNPSAATDKTLLIFGDSFFRQILPCLTHYFARIVFLRSRYFHDELVSAVAPDVIFAGCAERYLASVELDAARPHALSFPLIHGRPTDPTEDFAALWTLMVDSNRLAGAT